MPPPPVPSLWPSEFKVAYRSPISILKAQAAALGPLTQGILEGVVETVSTDRQVQHRLEVIAPACEYYRHTLFQVSHAKDMLYPATVVAEAVAERVAVRDPLVPVTLQNLHGVTYRTQYPEAADDDELAKLVSKVLRSEKTRGVITSLIIRSNEAGEGSSSYPLDSLEDESGESTVTP